MKKLNRKGYMTVEIIIASVIAFAIAFFLMEITIKLVDISDNEYVNTNFMTDKALIMKNVKKNISKYFEEVKNNEDSLMSFQCKDNGCDIESNDGLMVHLYIEDNKFIFKKEDSIIYSKELSDGLSNVSLNGVIEGNYVYFQIKGDNIFSNEIYDINIVVYNG
ncbi:MAG: hypothetical protein ACI310_01800 [Bacilli bacterium]